MVLSRTERRGAGPPSACNAGGLPPGFRKAPPLRGRTGSIPLVFAAVAVALAARPAATADSDAPPSPEAARLLDGVSGIADPSEIRRLSRDVPFDQLVRALYRGTRPQRLIALDVAGHLPDPWPALPYLAAFMGARERCSASRAAASLILALEDASARPEAGDEIVPRQLEQLSEQLVARAVDRRLDLDLRAAALEGLGLLSEIGGRGAPRVEEAFADPEPAVRGAALALLALPLDDEEIRIAAGMATSERDRLLRGQAAALLCENALSHGVEAPSKDLSSVLAAILGDPESPPGAVASVLGCLARFAPAARVDLVDLALRHPDPAVARYWEDLNTAGDPN